MGRQIRFLPFEKTTFEITSRTLQSRFLLRPSPQLNNLVLGIIGRAQELYQVELHFLVVMSNHIHIILSVEDSEILSKFMCYINGNIAREAGRLYGWRGKFWGRRYTAKAIMDEGALAARVRYLLSHGCKEGLVQRPNQWPGIHVIDALLCGQKLEGTWLDRTSCWRYKEKNTSHQICYRLRLTRPPLWQNLDEDEYRKLINKIVLEIEEETRQIFAKKGKKALGANMVLSLHPHDMPQQSKHSPAPCCHASSEAQKQEYRQQYRAFLKKYRQASEKLRNARLNFMFPEHCFPPPLPYTGTLSTAWSSQPP